MTDFPIYVAIATSGRRDTLTETLRELGEQNRLPDAVYVCPASISDFDAEASVGLPFPVHCVLSNKGGCIQRNAILSAIAEKRGLVTFFDDDFLPRSDYLQELEKLFQSMPDVAMATGKVLADGAITAGISLERARAILAADREQVFEPAVSEIYNGYGCNMTMRLDMVADNDIRFDERLPAYSWLEDVDISRVCAGKGRIVVSTALRGVHLAVKKGRSSGIPLGYSQIANPWYLFRKGTMHGDLALKQACRNIAANLGGAFRPEPWVDRRGRLYGNLLGLRDLVLARSAPENINDLKIGRKPANGMSASHRRRYLLLSLLVMMLAGGFGLRVVWSQAAAGEMLDLKGYRVTFEENFNDLSVSPWGPETRWIAHTPWNGDFGDARFVDPRPDFPFTIDKGILSITARKNADGKWESGLLAANDLKGHGFAQTFGYFEMRAKLPSGKGVWPAFWLMGTERSRYALEIDVMEFYGHAPTKFQSHYHIWSMDKVYPERHIPHMADLGFDLTADWHTFGVMVTPDRTTFYLDRKSYWSFPTPPEFSQPLFPLVNLALGSGFPITETPNPSVMLVDYVRIYAK